MSNYIVTGEQLTSIANAIRAKSGGESQLAFPTGFVSECGGIDAFGDYAVSQTGTTYDSSSISHIIVPANSYTDVSFDIGASVFEGMGYKTGVIEVGEIEVYNTSASGLKTSATISRSGQTVTMTVTLINPTNMDISVSGETVGSKKVFIMVFFTMYKK